MTTPNPFATYTELEARWRTLTTAERAKATTLLSDASAIIRARFASAGKEYYEVEDDILKQVCCAMVRRVMDLPSDLFGVSQSSQTAGSYSQSYTYSGSSGELYLKKSEISLLGLGGIRCRSISPHIGFSNSSTVVNGDSHD